VRRRIGALALATPTVEESARRVAIAARLPVHTWPDRVVLLTAIEAETGELTIFSRDQPLPPPVRHVPPNSTALRELLTAIDRALTLPAPATARDELTYLRIHRGRARLWPSSATPPSTHRSRRCDRSRRRPAGVHGARVPGLADQHPSGGAGDVP
jgi:hypothetical protein